MNPPNDSIPAEDPASRDRRASTDRRTNRDRRRGADGVHVVIEICQSQIHLAITTPDTRDEKQLLLCRSHQWRRNARTLLTDDGAEELRLALKQIATEERLAGAKATVLLDGELCVSRIAIGSSSAVESRISELSERGQLYLALGAGDKAIASSRYQLDARHEHAVVSVANHRTVDAVVDAAEAAGIELRAVEASATALCAAHLALHPEEQGPALIVQVDENSIDLAVSHRGRLLLEHRETGRTTPTTVLQAIERHHKRLARFCQRQGVEGELESVLLTGDAQFVETVVREGGRSAPLQVSAFGVAGVSTHWNLRDATPGPQHAAVIGGACAAAEMEETLRGPNLLERWIAESRKHIRPMLLRSAAPLAATLLIAAGMWFVNHEMRVENDRLRTAYEAKAPYQARANKLRIDLLKTKSKIDELTKLVDGSHSAPMRELIALVGGCLPNDVWLDQLHLSHGTGLQISGSSYTEGGAYDFVNHLKRAPGLSRVALQETSAGNSSNGPTTRFRVQATLSAPISPPEQAGGVAKR